MFKITWLKVFFIFCSIPSVFANINDSNLITNKSSCNPYTNYECLNNYLGQSFLERFIHYYKLEIGHNTAPANPNSPALRRKDWPKTPQSTPPMPFTEWPYGGTSPIGVSTPNAVDSPFMVAIENTATGKWHKDNHIQTYGWVSGGTNLSTNYIKPGGNAPMAYIYTPNNIQLDQMVLYVERVPDTVQTTNIDWGFRLSGFYGQNYRYTTAYGIASYQLLGNNAMNGYDFPMVYGELYIPNIAKGLVFRLGRFIGITDIEAQLAPNNYMYSHSMSYSFDNFTNQGLISSLAITNNLITQLGVTIGNDTAFWNAGKTMPNPSPNPLYPNATFLKDPGAKPSAIACVRYTWSDGDDTIYPCMNSINDGVWGYDNLQWYGVTYYHKFNSKWHLSYEIYTLFQKNVANLNNATAKAAIASGGTPFSPQYISFNAPNGAQCKPANLTCTARVLATVAYLNYQFSPLDNISFRPEFYDDKAGQRTGIKTRYLNFGIGWQHWLSPQIEFRPEIDYDYALDKNAFNGDANAGIAPNRRYTLLGAIDVIVHF
jgi:hypothetical protein